MSSNVKKAKTAASMTNSAGQTYSANDPSVNYGMSNGILPPASMLLHTNESQTNLNSNDSSMNSYPDLFNGRTSATNNGKTNKRKIDEIADTSSNDLESSSIIKPQKTDQNDSERTSSRTGTPLSNGPPLSSTPSRTNNDIGQPSYEFAPSNNNNGNSTSNSSLLTHQTPPPPSLQHQQSLPPGPPGPPSSYMHHMSPRNQFNMTSDTYLQSNNQVFVFTTQLANEAAEAVLNNEHPNIIDYHKSLPSTAQFLASISNNNHNPVLSGPAMHMNAPPPGCPSPRTMQMMMPGPPPPPHHHHHLNPHMQMHNGNLGPPPPNWTHPHFHPQQQPPFGRLTPGAGGLPPPNHLMPPGPMMMNGPSPSPGMRMGGMPPGMSPMPSDGIENLTPERAKHRKTQLNKIEDLKSKISGRGRGGRSKAGAGTPVPPGSMPPSMNGGPMPPGPMDPHQQSMMMMNSPHGVGPPHHMMGIGPPPPHMLPGGMRGPPDGMMLDMNGPHPPHPYMNGPMPPGFHGQFGGPPPNDPYGPLPPSHPQSQAVREWNKMQMEHYEGKVQHMRGQPPPYPCPSPSSLTPPIATTSAGNMLGPNGKLMSPRMEPSNPPRLYKVGQPEKFIPDSLPPTNKKLPGNIGEAQMTGSPSQMDYNEFGLEGEELVITRHLNRAYRPGNPPIPSSSSSCKDEPLTPSNRSTSTPNNNANPLSSGQGVPTSSQQQPPSGSTTPTHGPPSHLTSQSVPAVSPRSSKLNSNANNNTNLSSPLMFSNNNNNNNSNSTKDEPLDFNGEPKTPSSNMAPPLNSMLQMTNSLQTASSPYNPSSNQGSKSSMASPNYGHMSKGGPPPPPPSSMEHMNLPPPHMQFQNMNPHHRMIGPPDSMPPHFNPHHPGNLPPPHPHMYRMMPPHHGMDPNGMMMGHPPGPPGRSSKGHPLGPPPGLGGPSPDPMQSHLHHLPPPHYVKIPNMDPSLMGPGHPQQHLRFPPMMDEGFGMGPVPPHPHHPHMHPHHPMHLNDSRLPPPPPPQSINNTYVSATMSIQQLNIQNLGPGGTTGEMQAGTIHYHAPGSNGPDSQGGSYLSNDPSYPSQFNDLQGPPSNLSGDGVPPPNYW